jgi:hypothetical protein
MYFSLGRGERLRGVVEREKKIVEVGENMKFKF